jgi:hypothetical protein
VGELTDDAADKMLADMLALQGPELVSYAVSSANCVAFNNQSADRMFYKRAAKGRRTPENAAAFRRHVWWFIHENPEIRRKAKEKEAGNGSPI